VGAVPISVNGVIFDLPRDYNGHSGDSKYFVETAALFAGFDFEVNENLKFVSRNSYHWNSILHFGTFGGIPSMILWTFIPLLVPFFALTGIFLWRRRTRGRRERIAAFSKRRVLENRNP